MAIYIIFSSSPNLSSDFVKRFAGDRATMIGLFNRLTEWEKSRSAALLDVKISFLAQSKQNYILKAILYFILKPKREHL